MLKKLYDKLYMSTNLHQFVGDLHFCQIVMRKSIGSKSLLINEEIRDLC